MQVNILNICGGDIFLNLNILKRFFVDRKIQRGSKSWTLRRALGAARLANRLGMQPGGRAGVAGWRVVAPASGGWVKRREPWLLPPLASQPASDSECVQTGAGESASSEFALPPPPAAAAPVAVPPPTPPTRHFSESFFSNQRKRGCIRGQKVAKGGGALLPLAATGGAPHTL